MPNANEYQGRVAIVTGGSGGIGGAIATRLTAEGAIVHILDVKSGADKLRFHAVDIGDEAYWHKIGHTLAPKELVWNDVLEKPGMETLVIKGVRGGEFPGEVNVTVAPSKHPKIPRGLFINSNFHYAVPRNESGTPCSERVVRYMEMEWKSALDQARRVAYRIFAKIKKDAP